MFEKNKFAVIGGDSRQVYVINELVKRNYEVTYYGIEDAKISNKAINAKSANEALEYGNIVICPVPFTKDKQNIFSKSASEDANMAIENLIKELRPKHILIGGNIPQNVVGFCNDNSIAVIDLTKSDEFSLCNAVATAEGTIAEAILHSEINLHKSNCLVIGFGRCAKVLAQKLKSIGAEVTVSARREEALTEAYVCGYDTILLPKLKNMLPQFDFIFNTVPAAVLTANDMPYVNKEAVILDIASAPGGTDFNAAKEYGISADIYPGLPGKYSPRASGEIIAATVLSILKEGND